MQNTARQFDPSTILMQLIQSETMPDKKNALELLDDYIADLEARLNVKPGEVPAGTPPLFQINIQNAETKKKKEVEQRRKQQQRAANTPNLDQPDICKLEFKVGVIVKVWIHPDADKLYCEEIDVGEDEPRRIASGLRPHFAESEMLGQRLIVVTNLKAKNMVGFKSHGMVLCANEINLGTERVEFVEPPSDAAIGEVITFEGLPEPEPFTPAQVEKRKVWQSAATDMKTTDACLAAWQGHVFLTKCGPCKTRSIAGGSLR